MKIAVSGKGGVGKTTFAALLTRTLSKMGKLILAVDADPDANFASALGIPDAKPISEMKKLIFERTEVQPGSSGAIFKLNPKVDDLPDTLSTKIDNIKLIRLGEVKKGGGGCICPESALIRALVTHIVLARDEFVIMDMEAGIEHLGRAIAQAVDKLIIVVEPGRRSIETAANIKKLAYEIRLSNISVVGNKIRGKKDEEFLKENLSQFDFLGFIPYSQEFIEADLNGISPFDTNSSVNQIIEDMISKLRSN